MIRAYVNNKEYELREYSLTIQETVNERATCSFSLKTNMSVKLEKGMPAQIEAEDDLLFNGFCQEVEYKDYPAPKSPSKKATVTKDDVIRNLGATELNKYFTLQSKAAAIGKFIHEGGSISKAKVMLGKVIAEPNRISGAGRDTVVYKYTPSVNVDDVDNMFLSLMSEHRNLNAQLNSIKAKAIEEANKQNIANEQEYQKARTAYSKEYNDWLDKIEDLQSRFNQYIITEKEKISKLKINVPDSLMETYKSIKALLAE